MRTPMVTGMAICQREPCEGSMMLDRLRYLRARDYAAVSVSGTIGYGAVRAGYLVPGVLLLLLVAFLLTLWTMPT